MSANAKSATKRTRRNARRPERHVPTAPQDTDAMQNLEHLLDVMQGALARIVARAGDMRSDMGGAEQVDGDIARGGLSVVRGIATEALAEVFKATGRTS